MISARFQSEITSRLADLPARLALTQFAGESNKFALFLRGGFYLCEKWGPLETFWLNQESEILIDCPFPEALIKLSFQVIPAKRTGAKPALKLCSYQGQVKLFESELSKSEVCDIYISLIEGINPISFKVEGDIYSPFEDCGEADSRKLSFAFQSPFTVELLA